MSTSRPLRFKDFVFQGKNYTAEAVEVAAEAADAMNSAIDGFVDSLTTELTATYKTKISTLIAEQEAGVKALEETLAQKDQLLQKSLADLEAFARAGLMSSITPELTKLAAATKTADESVKKQIEQARELGKKLAEAAGQAAIKVATGGVG